MQPPDFGSVPQTASEATSELNLIQSQMDQFAALQEAMPQMQRRFIYLSGWLARPVGDQMASQVDAMAPVEGSA